MPTDDLYQLAHTGTDAEWFAANGMCGGCGNEGCHDGPCESVCQRCPVRIGQGLVRERSA